MKKRHILLGSLFLVAVLVWTAFFTWPTKDFSVYFLNVGQGDSALIKSPSGYKMLIDGGPSNQVLDELGKVMPFWDRKIDLIVLSHPHADHLTGLVEVVKRYRVGQILSTDAVHTSPEYLEWLEIIKEKNIPYELASQVSFIDLGAGAKAEVLYPKESFKDKKVEDLNDTSVVLRLSYAGVSFLFPGDLEETGQKKLITLNASLSSQFLKIPHHGSKTALDLNFLNAINPKVAIISVGENNRYGHPSKETIDKLVGRGVEIKRTDKDGTITVTVDTNGNWKTN